MLPTLGTMEDVARFTAAELAQATRNHGMPREGLRYDVTPIGLHYLLHHFDIPATNRDSWELSIGGAVGAPAALTMHEIEARPPRTDVVTLECAGNGRAYLEPPVRSVPWLSGAVGNARWTGTSLWPILEATGISDDAVEVVFSGVDRGVEDGIDQTYQRSLTIEEIRRPEVMLVYAMNDAKLLPQHGAPLRLIVPGWYGMASVKWLHSLEVVTEPFRGHHQTEGYIIRLDEEDPGRPASRVLPRSLMIPPGIPDADTRDRFAAPGSHRITGRAWSGFGDIATVEFSSDGGREWSGTTMEPPVDQHGWQLWTHDWNPTTTGVSILSSRATDVTGRTQPAQPVWNVGGYENNGIERIRVMVR